MKISIIGTGYVGLPTACVFARWEHNVVCVDNNPQKISQLQAGICPLYEKDLDKLMASVKGNILFTTDYASILNSDIVVLAVGTPMGENGEANLEYIYKAAQEAKPYLGNAVLVVKSTVPVGTCAKISKYIGYDKIASMPEFLREGFAVDDLFCPDRIIIGTPSEEIFRKIKDIYPLALKEKAHWVKSWESSELIKYASNAFLAIKIHYINEIADLCQETGANVEEVAMGMGLDSRIGNKFLNAGCGYGGSCFPKDTNAIYTLAEKYDVNLSLVGAAITGNRKRIKRFAHQINSILPFAEIKKIAFLGLAFKGGTDDVRESPALEILKNLNSDIQIWAYDPKAMNNAKITLKDKNILFADNMADCIKGAEMIIIATEWDEFKKLPHLLPMTSKEGLLKKPMVYDLKNVLDEDTIPSDCIYIRIGKKQNYKE